MLPFIRNENHFIDFGGASAPLFLCQSSSALRMQAAGIVNETALKQHEKGKYFPAIDPRLQLW